MSRLAGMFSPKCRACHGLRAVVCAWVGRGGCGWGLWSGCPVTASMTQHGFFLCTPGQHHCGRNKGGCDSLRYGCVTRAFLTIHFFFLVPPPPLFFGSLGRIRPQQRHSQKDLWSFYYRCWELSRALHHHDGIIQNM